MTCLSLGVTQGRSSGLNALCAPPVSPPLQARIFLRAPCFCLSRHILHLEPRWVQGIS